MKDTKKSQQQDKEKDPKRPSDKEKPPKSNAQDPSQRASSKTQQKKDPPADPSKSSKQQTEVARRKDDKEGKNKQKLYRESDDSEFCVHFYIQNVYLSPTVKIDDFLGTVRERINKAGVCEYVHISYYYENEVKLSVGMKYDIDALAILNRKRMILLYNRDNKLYETKPVIAPSFELYNLAKKGEATQGTSSRKTEKAYEKKKYSSDSRDEGRSRSKGHSRSKGRKRKSEDSRKKEVHHHTGSYVRRSNYEKNLIKEKRYRSNSRYSNFLLF